MIIELWEDDVREWKAADFVIVGFYGYETYPAGTILAKFSLHDWEDGNESLKGLFNDLYRRCVETLGKAPADGDDNKIAIEVLDKENDNKKLYVCYYDFAVYVATELCFPYNSPRRIEIK